MQSNLESDNELNFDHEIEYLDKADGKDEDYFPSQESEEEAEEEEEVFGKYERVYKKEKNINLHEMQKFIIFLNCLLKLFTWVKCPDCGNIVTNSCRKWGTLLIVTFTCVACNAVNTWYSQPFMGNIPAGNILLSAAILFSGNLPTKSLRMLRQITIAVPTDRTFFRHQRECLHICIEEFWSHQQARNYSMIESENRFVVLGGDGRCDSPGHSAKFGTYTILELDSNIILETEVFTVYQLLHKIRISLS